MIERDEQSFWAHKTGLIIALPPESTKLISRAVLTGQPIPSNEGRRLNVINQDPILNNRYPTPEHGYSYMKQVDTEWREKLYVKSEIIGKNIVDELIAMGKIAKDKNGYPLKNKEGNYIADAAIILFGSVAKNLAKSKHNPDPSNIDIAVIGEFTEEQRDELFDRIHDIREIGKENIGNNIGIIIHQNTDKLRTCNYNQALTYIGSSARPLYDPLEIWANIEKDALDHCEETKRYRVNCRKTKLCNNGHEKHLITAISK